LLAVFYKISNIINHMWMVTKTATFYTFARVTIEYTSESIVP